MRIPRIYTDQVLALQQIIELDENASRHIAKVLRMEAGRSLVLFNGLGGQYNATLVEVGKKRVSAQLDEFFDDNKQSPLSIHLGVGLSKGDRFEWVLQKAAELGVSQITPLFTERSEVKLNGPRLDKKMASWQQVLISACEQCQLNIVPQLLPPSRLEPWLEEREEQKRFVLHHRTDEALDANQQVDSAALLIGPEGGLSAAEINLAEQQSFQALRLGPRVFRTETAPLAAISILQYLWGDLN